MNSVPSRAIRSQSKSFLFDAYVSLFSFLRKLSLFGLINHLISDTSYHRFVDLYVLINLLISIVCWWDLPPGRSAIAIVCLVYGLLRCFELIVLHVNQLFFDEYRALRDKRPIDPLDSRRLVLLVVHNYTELVFWFAFAYRQFAEGFSQPGTVKTLSGSLYFSIVTMSTTGYGEITPAPAWQWRTLVVAQIAIGIFLIVSVLARWLALVPSLGRPELMGYGSAPDNSPTPRG